MTTSANSLLATVNCEFPLCDQEAATGSTRCRVHGGVKPTPDMDRLRAMYGPDPEHAPAETKWAAYKRAERARNAA